MSEKEINQIVEDIKSIDSEEAFRLYMSGIPGELMGEVEKQMVATNNELREIQAKIDKLQKEMVELHKNVLAMTDLESIRIAELQFGSLKIQMALYVERYDELTAPRVKK